MTYRFDGAAREGAMAMMARQKMLTILVADARIATTVVVWHGH